MTDKLPASTLRIGLPSGSLQNATVELRRPPDNFFDIAKYPTVTFKSKRVQGDGPGKLKMIGDLAMHGVTFQLDGRGYTYEGFYRGFGLIVTAEMLFAAFVAWYLGAHPGSGGLGWALAALQAASLVLSVIYFFPVTWIFSAVILVCVAWAAWLGGRRR